MKLQLIRNATLKLQFAGSTILVDPYFAGRHTLPSFAGRSPNPLVELPRTIPEIIDGVELVIVSHLHSDHFDTVAQAALPRQLPIVCQPGNERFIRDLGFEDVTPLTDRLSWRGIEIVRRPGSHGIGAVVEKMGSVMGFTLTGPGEPSVYWAGDTVLYPDVLDTVAAFRPDVIVTHSCGALWDGDLIVMDSAQTIALSKAAPNATIVATHMEALDHATVSRDDLRNTASGAGVTPHVLLIPADGEELLLLPA